jgi:hypothetical protein
MSVGFHYGIRNGWLMCGLTVNDVTVIHPVNGMYDGLKELIVASCEMLGRSQEATACFEEEPGEYRWRITRLNVNRVRVRVIAFDNWGSGLSDEEGKLLFDSPCGLISFAKAVHEGSSEWLAELKRTTRIGNKADDVLVKHERLGNLLRSFDFS